MEYTKSVGDDENVSRFHFGNTSHIIPNCIIGLARRATSFCEGAA